MKFYALRAVIVILIVRFLAKIFFVEMPAVPSVMALIQKGNQFLFIDLTYKKGFGLPGGVIVAGESAEEALKREVREETGLEVIGSSFLWTVATKTKGIGSLSLVFEVDVQGEIHDSEEGEVIWLTPEDAFGQLAYQTNEIALRRYMKSR